MTQARVAKSRRKLDIMERISPFGGTEERITAVRRRADGVGTRSKCQHSERAKKNTPL